MFNLQVWLTGPAHLPIETHIPTCLELVELYVLKEKDKHVKYTIMTAMGKKK
jgi:hypothetical protein